MQTTDWPSHLYPLLCISTVDASRVVLSVPDVNGSDYINASYIDVSIHEIAKMPAVKSVVCGTQTTTARTV